MQFLICIIGMIALGFGLFFFIKGKNYLKITAERLLKEVDKQYKEQYNDTIKKLNEEINEVENLIQKRKEQLTQKEQELHDVEERYNKSIRRAADSEKQTQLLIDSQSARLEREEQLKKELLEVQFEQMQEKNQEQIKLLYQHKLNEAETNFQKLKEELDNIIKEKQGEIQIIQNELGEYKAKQDAINQEILRHEKLKNEQNFHKINLEEMAKTDIHYLLSIEKNINNKELLHKLIWSEYIQRPFNIMLNKNFGLHVPKNVIYCIERIEDGKKYIGKTSGEVSKRWTDHIKNSLNIGTIKRQPIHDALFNNWDGFTWSIIEEVKDDKLSEREKYYINFYQTDKYGFNIKSGG